MVGCDNSAAEMNDIEGYRVGLWLKMVHLSTRAILVQ